MPPWAPTDTCISKTGGNGFYLKMFSRLGSYPSSSPTPAASFLPFISLTILKCSSQNLEMRSQPLSPSLPPPCLLTDARRQLTLKIHSVTAPKPSVWHLKVVPFHGHHAPSSINSLLRWESPSPCSVTSIPTDQVFLPLHSAKPMLLLRRSPSGLDYMLLLLAPITLKHISVTH